MGDRLTQTSRKQRRIRRSVGWSLFLAAALCLSAGPAWAQATPSPTATQGSGVIQTVFTAIQSFLSNIVNALEQDNNQRIHSAPEIDASVAVSALAILTGGILLVGDRVRKSRRNREG